MLYALSLGRESPVCLQCPPALTRPWPQRRCAWRGPRHAWTTQRSHSRPCLWPAW